MPNSRTKEFFSPFKTATYIDMIQKKFLALADDYKKMDKEFDELAERHNKADKYNYDLDA